MTAALTTERVRVADLRPHPRNYRRHPEDQVAHIVRSLVEHGQYRAVVIANDNTVLAGHGVVAAFTVLGVEEVQAVRMPYGPDDPDAISLLVGDNEISRMAEVDDRTLTGHLQMLAELSELQGTGFDEQMVAELLYVTRSVGELAGLAEATELMGLDGAAHAKLPQFAVSFDTEEGRDEFVARLGLEPTRSSGRVWTARWPTVAEHG